MIELLRNCSHGSEIATYLKTDESKEKTIIKTASTPSGIKDLQHEVEGWNWYQRIRFTKKRYPLCAIVQQRDTYLQIQVEFINGTKPNYRRGLGKNASIVKQVIEYYCNFWPYYPNEQAPIHGDLSLDNIIYNAESIYIIDWEHFILHGGPWGYDALYLLFETLWFGMKGRRRPTYKEINIIAENLNILNSHTFIKSYMIERPLWFLKDFISKNSKIWSEQLSQYPNKFPILAFTDIQVCEIDSLIHRRLQV